MRRWMWGVLCLAASAACVAYTAWLVLDPTRTPVWATLLAVAAGVLVAVSAVKAQEHDPT